MRAIFNTFLGFFLTPVGIVVMGMLDASIFFFLPLGLDFVVVIMAARRGELFWMYALLAALGSVLGAAVTYWIGGKAGKHGLARLVNPSRLRKVQDRVSQHGAYTVAAIALMPPPFPYTAFLLAIGAFKVHAGRFFTGLAGFLVLRFMVEGALAAYYGRAVLRWMQSPVFTGIVVALAAVAIVGTIVTAVSIMKRRRQPALA